MGQYSLLAGLQVGSLIVVTVVTGSSVDEDGRDITTLP